MQEAWLQNKTMFWDFVTEIISVTTFRTTEKPNQTFFLTIPQETCSPRWWHHALGFSPHPSPGEPGRAFGGAGDGSRACGAPAREPSPRWPATSRACCDL